MSGVYSALDAVLPPLEAVALTLHAGGLGIFALLMVFRARIPHLRDEDVVRVFRSFGAGFGLSLGVLMAAGVYRHVSVVNPDLPLPSALGLRFDSPALAWASLRSCALVGLWVSYIRLEVWTVEPCRRLDRDGVVSDVAAYGAATSALSRHLAVNAALGMAVVVFGALAGAA